MQAFVLCHPLQSQGRSKGLPWPLRLRNPCSTLLHLLSLSPDNFLITVGQPPPPPLCCDNRGFPSHPTPTSKAKAASPIWRKPQLCPPSQMHAASQPLTMEGLILSSLLRWLTTSSERPGKRACAAGIPLIAERKAGFSRTYSESTRSGGAFPSLLWKKFYLQWVPVMLKPCPLFHLDMPVFTWDIYILRKYSLFFRS